MFIEVNGNAIAILANTCEYDLSRQQGPLSVANDNWASMTRLAILLVVLSWINGSLTQSERDTNVVVVSDVQELGGGRTGYIGKVAGDG